MKHVFFLACLLTCAHSCLAATIFVGASKDNTLYEDPTGAVSNGAGEYFFAGQTGPNASNKLRRAVIAFDVADAVPPDSVIQSVSLRLNLSVANLGVPQAGFALHPLLSDWGEGTSNAGAPGGAGASSTPGDATWQHRFFSGSVWSTPGGHFVPGASLSTTVGGADVYHFSSAQMAADVQAWLDTPASNFGWLVRGSENVPNSARRFDSRENANAARRPLLTIVYEPVPEPAAVMFLVCGAAAFVRRRAMPAGRHSE